MVDLDRIKAALGIDTPETSHGPPEFQLAYYDGETWAVPARHDPSRVDASLGPVEKVESFFDTVALSYAKYKFVDPAYIRSLGHGPFVTEEEFKRNIPANKACDYIEFNIDGQKFYRLNRQVRAARGEVLLPEEVEKAMCFVLLGISLCDKDKTSMLEAVRVTWEALGVALKRRAKFTDIYRVSVETAYAGRSVSLF